MRTRPLVLALVVLAGCASAPGAPDSPPPGTPPGDPPAPPAPGALADVWAGLDEAAAGVAGRGPDVCAGPFGTWFSAWGGRGLACVAAQVVDPAAVLARAPVAPFESGPHVATEAAVRFDLEAGRAFGHYDPAFVRWLVEAGVPDGATARRLAKPIYDRRLARLARVYWLAHRDLARGGFPADVPAGPLAAYAAYLDGGPADDGGDTFAVFAFTDRSEALLPDVGVPVENDWTVKYEANTAYGFWLRRRADGTHALWLDGLRQLLAAFDAPWLAAHGG